MTTPFRTLAALIADATGFARSWLTGVGDAAAGRTALGLGTAATQASSAFEAAGAVAAAAAAADRQFASRGNTTALRLAGTSESFDVCISTLQTGDNGVLDDVVFVGLNYLGPTGRQDATQASIHDGWENCYKQYPGSTYNQSERYVQYVLPDGTNGRTWMCEVRHTGPADIRVNNSLWGNQAFRRVGDDSLTGYYSDGGILTLYARIDFPTNNAPVLRQHKAAGGDNWVSLVYLDATDTTQVGEGGPVATGWTLTSAAGFDLQYDYAVRAKSSDGKSATEAVRLRNDTGRLTFGQSGQSMDVAGRAYFTHVPSFASDAVVTVAPAFTGKNTGYYAAALTPAIAGDNSGSNHATLWLGPTVTAGTYTAGSHFPAFARTTFNGATVPDGWGGFRSQAVAVGGATVGEYAHYDVLPAYVDAGSGSKLAPQVGFRAEGLRATDWVVRTGDGLHGIGSGAAQLGFFGATPVVRPAVTGSQGGNTALASLITQLAALGLVTDSTTA